MTGYVLRAAPDLAEAIARMVETDFPEVAGVGTYHDPETLPWVMVDDLGGAEDRFGGSHGVDLEVLADDYDEAKSLCSRLVAYLLGYPRSVEVDGRKVTLDRVEAQGPRELPWEDSSIRRFMSTLQISFRR